MQYGKLESQSENQNIVWQTGLFQTTFTIELITLYQYQCPVLDSCMMIL